MDQSPSISLGQAFAHCASTGSYWLWIIIVLVLGIGGIFGIKIYANKINKSLDTPLLIWVVVFVLALATAVFMRPEMVAANTSIEMMKNGHWLGY